MAVKLKNINIHRFLRWIFCPYWECVYAHKNLFGINGSIFYNFGILFSDNRTKISEIDIYHGIPWHVLQELYRETMDHRPLGKILAGYCFYDGCEIRPLKVCLSGTYYYQEERRKGKTAWKFVQTLYKLFVSCRFPAAFRAVIVSPFFIPKPLYCTIAQSKKYFTVRNERRRKKSLRLRSSANRQTSYGFTY